ncbi:hypothetical protein [Nocardia sp. NPDC051570]|uniref:hypothetical protein n=1 Tax=Nocardia sp. NPDC051570 TaxID=3364324 RepID=UPI0037B45D6F
MHLEDELAIRSLLLAGAVTVGEANALRRKSPLIRDFTDFLLLDLAGNSLADKSRDAFAAMFGAFVRARDREPHAAIRDLATPVAQILTVTAEGYGLSNRYDRAKAVLHELGGPTPTERAQSLALHARVITARIRDDIVHPIIGLSMMKHPVVRDDDTITTEVTAIAESNRLYQLWLEDRAQRYEVEAAARELAHTVSWNHVRRMS